MGYQIANSLYGIRLNLSGNKAYLEMNMTENQFNKYKISYNENISHMFNGARNITDNFINNLKYGTFYFFIYSLILIKYFKSISKEVLFFFITLRNIT